MMNIGANQEEVQSAVGHLKAELDNAKFEFQHGRLTVDSYRQTVQTIRRAAKRFYNENHRTGTAVLAVSME